jgi:hypothetical protein
MGKKAAAPVPSPAPAPQMKPISLADALRGALSDLGIDASRADVEGWIKAKYPALEYKDTTLNSSLSNLRKKLRGEGSGVSGADLTLHEIMKVNGIAADQGGVEALLGLIEKLETVAAKVGGIGRLRHSLEALKKIKG